MIPCLRSIFLLFFALVCTHQPVQASDDPPLIFSGNIAGDDTSTRFFADFSKGMSVQTFYLDEPFRIVVDVGQAKIASDMAAAFEPRGLVRSVFYEPLEAGTSRIVLTLSKPAEIVRASMQKVIDEDFHRFLLDIEATSDDRFSTLLEAQKLVLGGPAPVAERGDRVKRENKKTGRFTVVIDPGHGGIDGGATGRHGVQEKIVVLDFAKDLQEQISNAGPFDVKLTREEDVFISLRERLEFSRRMEADLFISIHADSLSDRSVRGSTIYTLSKKASDSLSEKLAEAENKVDLFAGLPVLEESEAIFDILVDLTTRETKTFSRQFSRILMTNLGEEVRLIKNPVRSAAFGVLKAPDVPGVLLELGYLSNDEDEKLLKSEVWRRKAAAAVTRSIVAFFEPRFSQ